MKFVVILQKSDLDYKVIGPFSKFKEAEGIAKAWDISYYGKAWVEPLIDPKPDRDLTKELMG